MDLAFSVSTEVEGLGYRCPTYQMMDAFNLATTRCSGIETTLAREAGWSPGTTWSFIPTRRARFEGSRAVVFVQ